MPRREMRTGGVVSWVMRARRDGPTTNIWSTRGWVGGRVQIAAVIGTARTIWRRSPRREDPRSWRRLSGTYESAPCDQRSDDRVTSSNASPKARALRREDRAVSSTISRKARDTRWIVKRLAETKMKRSKTRWIREIRTDREDTRR